MPTEMRHLEEHLRGGSQSVLSELHEILTLHVSWQEVAITFRHVISKEPYLARWPTCPASASLADPRGSTDKSPWKSRRLFWTRSHRRALPIDSAASLCQDCAVTGMRGALYWSLNLPRGGGVSPRTKPLLASLQGYH